MHGCYLCREYYYANEGSCADSNSLDVVGSYNKSHNSSTLTRKKPYCLPSSVDSYVNIASHSNSHDARVGNIDELDVDGMEIQMDLSDDLLHMVTLLLYFHVKNSLQHLNRVFLLVMV